MMERLFVFVFAIELNVIQPYGIEFCLFKLVVIEFLARLSQYL